MKNQSEYKNSGGFTLLEIMIVLTIMGLVAPYIAPDYILKLDERRSDVAIAETAAIYSAAANYRNINGAWPGGVGCNTAINDLAVNSFLSGVDATNSFNNGIVTSCTPTEFTIVQEIDTDTASYVSAGLPATQVTNAGTGQITSIFPLPGAEPALNSLLDLAGTRVMTGNLQMGGNDITNAGSMSATSDMRAPRFYDSNDTNYFVDPAGTSVTSRMDATSQMRSPVYYDRNNTSFYGHFDGRSQLNTMDVSSIRDRDNTAYTIDPSSTSRMDFVDGNVVRGLSNVTIGSSCASYGVGAYARSGANPAFCNGTVWASVGGSGDGLKSKDGWADIGGGMIIQWGSTGSWAAGYSGWSNKKFYFPKPFPNTCFTVVMNPRSSTHGSFVFPYSGAKSWNKSYFVMQHHTPGTTWFAVGY